MSAKQQNYATKTLSSRLNLANHFIYPLIKLFMFLNFQFAAFTKFILLENRMSSELPSQFDGLFKIA